MADLDIDLEVLAGNSTPAAVFNKVETAVNETLASRTNVPLTTINISGLSDSNPKLKQTFGKFKEPVPAELGVIDMVTGEYVVIMTKFFLNSVNRGSTEKYQIVHGFDEEWLFTVFGKEVPVYRLGGTLLNLANEQDWVKAFHDLYENYLRASLCVENKRQVFIRYSNRVIRGYVVGRIETDDAELEQFVQFSMDFVIRKDNMIEIDFPEVDITAEGTTVEGTNLV